MRGWCSDPTKKREGTRTIERIGWKRLKQHPFVEIRIIIGRMKLLFDGKSQLSKLALTKWMVLLVCLLLLLPLVY